MLLSAPVALSGAGKLYGTPASIEPRTVLDLDKFKLPLARAGLPVELWESLAKISSLWEHVLSSDTEKQAFEANPANYFKSLGLDSTDELLVNESVLLLRGIADTAVQENLIARNYAKVYSRLGEIGVFDLHSPSSLQDKIESIFSSNINEIKNSLETMHVSLTTDEEAALLSSMNEAGIPLTIDDLAHVSQLLAYPSMTSGLQPMCTSLALCVVAVGIAATVVVYVSVVVAATVGILAAVYVSAAIWAAITIGGTGPHPQIASSNTGQLLGSAPFRGEYIKLDPVVMRNTDRAIRIAKATGDKGLQLYAAREAIRIEVQAVFAALRNVHVIELNDEALARVTDVVARYSWHMLGI